MNNINENNQINICDEIKFANAEATNLLDKINRIKNKNIKIWNRTNKKQNTVDDNLNFPRISSKRKFYNQYALNSSLNDNYNSYSNYKQYFNKIEYNSIYQANSIIKKNCYVNNIKKELTNKTNNIYEDCKLNIYKIDNKENNNCCEFSELKNNYNIISMKNYVNSTKNLFLKNNILKILNEEKQEISNKENNIEKALKQGEKKLEKDQEAFKRYCKKEKNNEIESEKELNKLIFLNKNHLDEKRKLIHDQKRLSDELDKIIKSIFNTKIYALFVCYTLGNRELVNIIYPKYVKSFLENSIETNYYFLKESNLNKQISTLIKDHKVFVQSNLIDRSILNHPIYLINKISNIESKIINQCKTNQDLNSIISRLKNKKIKYLKENENNKMKVYNELKNISNEYDKNNLENEELKNKVKFNINSEYNCNISIQEKYIVEILNIISNINQNNCNTIKGNYNSNYGIQTKSNNIVSVLNTKLNISSMNIQNSINRVRNNSISKKSISSSDKNMNNKINYNYIINLIEKLESKISFLIDNLNNIQKNEPVLFEKLLQARKNFNKKNAFEEANSKMKKKQNNKLARAKERSNRIILKGKKYFRRINNVKTIKTVVEKKDDKEDKDNLFLYF